MSMAHDQTHDDAPKRAQRDDKDGDYAIVGRSVLINRPRSELFAYWRDFTKLPTFMHAVESVAIGDGERSTWTIKAPAGQHVTLETELVDVIENEAIGWRSTEHSQIKTTGHVTFTDAPAGRGTIVTAEIAYEPPGGDVGRLIAKLFQAEPNIQARHELKRFKQLMEAGEVATGAYTNSTDGEV
ncbi:SRPBCC family protein [Devosia sediminis]|uniref:SRPBCC family protein n=1 Tax=Devosia sediminis TaxID=2798801 RepID=A0A934IUR0_9HYPH|nr:SRPBCC family protein [Devosia sediminis]MBJ3784717.1 SRPBCC family protein [Devosia sediminis]